MKIKILLFGLSIIVVGVMVFNIVHAKGLSIIAKPTIESRIKEQLIISRAFKDFFGHSRTIEEVTSKEIRISSGLVYHTFEVDGQEILQITGG